MGQLPDILSTDDCGLPKNDFSFVTNPLTDESYEEHEAHVVGVAAMSHTAARALVYVNGDGGGNESIVDHRAVWGDTVGVKPTLTRNGTGDYTLTWASAYDDLNPTPARVVSHTVNIEFAVATITQDVVGHICVTWTANTVTVKTYDAASAAADYDFVVAVF